MTKRVCANVRRGVTDATTTWVYPWEVPILEHIHGGQVTVVPIDELIKLHDGVVKIDTQRLKHSFVQPPTLKEQYEIMAWVDPEEDPARDPDAEFNRLVEKYGMDEKLPIANVVRIYGEVASGQFAKILERHKDDHAKKPELLRWLDLGLNSDPRKMTVGQLRDLLSAEDIDYQPSDNKEKLVNRLLEDKRIELT